MEIVIEKTASLLGEKAAEHAVKVITKAIKEKGVARILLSTGASQFEFFKVLTQKLEDWSAVEMFHLDEYINLPVSHPASFRKYLFERFVSKINLKRAVFVNGEGDYKKNIEFLNKAVTESPIDLGVIGIGENAHIAFNDPPADFETEIPYIVVDLDDSCKKQQVREGWFENEDTVPKQAISMSVKQILKCKEIISFVPYAVKAEAVKKTIEQEINNMSPSTIFKSHPCLTLYLDAESSALINNN